MEEQVTDGRLGALALHGASCLTGGIPLKVDGEVVGAIGTSGETPDEDEAVSIAGAAADFSVTEVAGAHLRGRPARGRGGRRRGRPRAASPRSSPPSTPAARSMFLVRPDLAQVASVEVTTDKARTAAIYRRPSKDFEDQASGGRPSALHLARAVPLQGGVPIEHDGEVIGAIGVSGATVGRRGRRARRDRRRSIGAAIAAPATATALERRGLLPRRRGGRAVPRRRAAARHRPATRSTRAAARRPARSSTTSTSSTSCTW